MKPRILLIGDHPNWDSGNGHMMHGIISQIDRKSFDISVFAITPSVLEDAFKVRDFPIIEIGKGIRDQGTMHVLAGLLESQKIDIVLVVGLDIWAFYPFINEINEIKKRKGISWVSIFPWDCTYFREDWLEMTKIIDSPCVYSQYGFDQLSGKLENLVYFRPPLFEHEKFVRFSQEDRMACREKAFPTVPPDDIIFGFVGNNQFRKDPQRLVRCFFDLKKEMPNIHLYLHTDIKGRLNIKQYLNDCGIKPGDVFIKESGKIYSTEAMVETYNCMDCYVLPSLQEGLSWTPVEAKLCGVPGILSDNTAHTELIDDGGVLGVECTDLAYLISETASGLSFVETRACNPQALRDQMKVVAYSPTIRKMMSDEAVASGKRWVEGISNINPILHDTMGRKNVFRLVNTTVNIKKKAKKEERVLFAQHSSAGDVLMTTRCFKGLKERYGLPLDYMTSIPYMNIIEGNPYIEKIIPWDGNVAKEYRHVVNPHGDRIAPGHWGRNSNSLLADFYWKILGVVPTDIFLKMTPPKIISRLNLSKPFVIVHTTGGDPEFRTYAFMEDVCKGIKKRGFQTVQVGGKKDCPGGADIDFRGKLTYGETGWLVQSSSYAITVDSFVSHLVGFLGKPQVCLFGSGNYNVVRPVQKASLICRVPDYVQYCKGLGPCSASVRDCPIKCTGIHDPKDLLKDFFQLVENKGKKPFLKIKVS